MGGSTSEHKQVADEPTMLPPKMNTQCGSPEYAAPEVIRNDSGYDGAPVDVWSLGVVLYAMICGTLPFTAGSIPQIVSNTLRGRFHIPSHVSSDAANLLKLMLNTNHKKRITLSETLEHSWFKIRPKPHKKIEVRPLMMVRALPDKSKKKNNGDGEESEEIQRLVALSVTEPPKRGGLETSSSSKSDTEWLVDSLNLWESKSDDGTGRSRSIAVNPKKNKYNYNYNYNYNI